MKKILILIGATMLSIMAPAQEKVETTISSDLVSQYLWRGLNLGQVSVQPTLGIGYKGLSLSAWGNYGISNANDAKEIDLTLCYQIGGFSICLIDYWFDKDGGDPQGRYFRYYAHSTNHVFEAGIGYDFKVLSLQWFTNFAGNDGRTASDKRAYSSYFEASVPFRLATVEWKATLGIVPYATSYYETSGFAVTNITLRADKSIRITDTFSLPLFAQFTANPRSEMAYLAFGFTLQP